MVAGTVEYNHGYMEMTEVLSVGLGKGKEK